MRWFLIGFAFVLVAVTGIVAGAMLSGSGDSASAATTQPRESQVTIHSDALGFQAGSFSQASYFTLPWMPVVALDAADYPAGATFKFEVTFAEFAFEPLCLRLAELDTDLPVAGSEVCHSTAGTVRHRTNAFVLAAGENEYRLQASCPAASCSYDNWTGARVIAEWNEPLVADPNPDAVGGMVELISGSSGGGLGRLPEMAAALLLLGVGGMYVAKGRRD